MRVIRENTAGTVVDARAIAKCSTLPGDASRSGRDAAAPSERRIDRSTRLETPSKKAV
jgi:hypothetical protein